MTVSIVSQDYSQQGIDIPRQANLRSISYSYRTYNIHYRQYIAVNEYSARHATHQVPYRTDAHH